MMNVAIIGASSNPERFAHRAQEYLIRRGHKTFPVNPKGGEILGRSVYGSVLDIPAENRPIHTAVIYVNPDHLAHIADEISELHPGRVIFNPGTECPEIAERFREEGMHVVEACALVLLEEERFESA